MYVLTTAIWYITLCAPKMLWLCYPFQWQIAIYCIMCPSVLSVMYTQAQGPQGKGHGCTYPANHKGTWYNCYVPYRLIACGRLIIHSIWYRLPNHQLVKFDCGMVQNMYVDISRKIVTVSWKNSDFTSVEKPLHCFIDCLQHLLIIYRVNS